MIDKAEAQRRLDVIDGSSLPAADAYHPLFALCVELISALPSGEPFRWMYTVNGVNECFSSVKPPDDAYDEGTLMPLYAGAPPAAVEPDNLLMSVISNIGERCEAINDADAVRYINSQLDRLASYKTPCPHLRSGDSGSQYCALAARRPETTAEEFIQAEIDRAPEPLQRLGKFLADVLDESDFATAQRMLLGGIEAANRPQAGAVPDVAAFDKAVADELPRVSHLEYDSHEICKHFAGKVRDRMLSAAPATGESK